MSREAERDENQFSSFESPPQARTKRKRTNSGIEEVSHDEVGDDTDESGDEGSDGSARGK